MKTFKFVPKSLEGTEFSGHVMIDLLKYTDRLRLTSKCQFKIDESGKIAVGVEALETIATMIDLSEPHIKEVDIKSKDTHFKSFEDLQCGAPSDLCGKILSECASVVMNGNELSGNSKAP